METRPLEALRAEPSFGAKAEEYTTLEPRSRRKTIATQRLDLPADKKKSPEYSFRGKQQQGKRSGRKGQKAKRVRRQDGPYSARTI